MADPHGSSPKPPVWDGRFGARFDDEVSARGVAFAILGIAVLTFGTMVALIFMYRWMMGNAVNGLAQPSPLAVGDQPGPPLPRLQAAPEVELRALRAEFDERLSTYGWVDQSAGIAHIPIEEAMTLLLEQGLPETTGAEDGSAVGGASEATSGTDTAASRADEDVPAEDVPAGVGSGGAPAGALGPQP